MASELFTELASSGFHVAPGNLGENVTTAGLDLTNFPLGTCLRIGNSAIVELTGLRTPCALIDRLQKGLKRAMIMKHEQPMFRCGVLGVVRATGQSRPAIPCLSISAVRRTDASRTIEARETEGSGGKNSIPYNVSRHSSKTWACVINSICSEKRFR